MTLYSATLISIVVNYKPKQIPLFRLKLNVDGKEIFFDVWDRIHARLRRSNRVSRKKVFGGKNFQLPLGLIIESLRSTSSRIFLVEEISETGKFRISLSSLEDWIRQALHHARCLVLQEKAKEEGIGEEEIRGILSSIT